jgi:hypothetical protein
VRYIRKRHPGLPTDVDYDLIEVFTRHMVPDSQFPDSAESIYTKFQSCAAGV